MKILDRLFRFDELERVLSQESLLENMLAFEAHLARAEATANIIPGEAAETIAAACKLESLNLGELAAGTASDGNIAIPLVRQLTTAVSKVDSEAARYVHWGATSQDVIDTARELQMRDAVRLIVGELDRLCEALNKLTIEHRSTVMAGRTWLQQATPTTFGFKTAQMLHAVMKHRDKLVRFVDESCVLQFGGAVGTLAALGENGPKVASSLAKGLALKNPDVPWHTDRSPFAELAALLGLLSGALGKIARDVALLSQTEIAEVSEGGAGGGSSTMPQKRNSVRAAAILSNCLRVPGLVSTLLGAMVQEHERGLGNWHAEWETLPEMVSLAGGAAHHSANMISDLQVDSRRMRHNLETTNGLIYAEAVAFKLAAKIGKPAAHELLKSAGRRALECRKHLAEVLVLDPKVTQHFRPDELKGFFDPQQYLGSAHLFIDAVLNSYTVQQQRHAGH